MSTYNESGTSDMLAGTTGEEGQAPAEAGIAKISFDELVIEQLGMSIVLAIDEVNLTDVPERRLSERITLRELSLDSVVEAISSGWIQTFSGIAPPGMYSPWEGWGRVQVRVGDFPNLIPILSEIPLSNGVFLPSSEREYTVDKEVTSNWAIRRSDVILMKSNARY